MWLEHPPEDEDEDESEYSDNAELADDVEGDLVPYEEEDEDEEDD